MRPQALAPLPASIARLSRGSSFALSFMLLPPEPRRGIRVLYAFCRMVDDASDSAAVPSGKAALARWRSLLAGRRRPADALEREVLAYCDRFQVPRQVLDQVVQGALSDLRPSVRFKDRRALERYCGQVAGAVGLACLPLFGCGIEAGRRFAMDLGLGLQLTNILRDVAEDAGRGRLYLPLADLKAQGLEPAALLQGQDSPRARALFREIAAWADAALARARQHALGLRGADLRPAMAMARAYGALLRQMRDSDFDVLTRRHRLGAARKGRALLGAALGRGF